MRWTSPTARLLLGLGLVAAVATAPPVAPSLAAAGFVALGLLPLSRPSLRFTGAVLAVGGASVAGVLAPLAFTGDHDTLVRLAARATVTLVVAASVASAQRPSELAGALRGLGLPLSLSAVVATMSRQARLLAPEARRIVLARELRGATGSAAGVDVMARLLARSARRAERLALASALRGGDGPLPQAFSIRRTDALPLAAGGVVAIAVHWAGGAAP